MILFTDVLHLQHDYIVPRHIKILNGKSFELFPVRLQTKSYEPRKP